MAAAAADTDVWEELDFYSLADWFPDAVDHYLNGDASPHLPHQIRMHLACLGWRIDLHKITAPQSKFRYTSPTRHHRYFSLRQACLHLAAPNSAVPDNNADYEEEEEDDCEEEDDFDDDEEEEIPNSGSVCDLGNEEQLNRFVGKPHYDPDSVMQWIEMTEGAGRSQSKSEVSLRVKRHLLFINWDLYYVVKGCPNGARREELRYRPSPPHNSRAHNSLINACNFLVNEGLIQFDNAALQSQPKSSRVKRKIGHNIKGISTQASVQGSPVLGKIGDNDFDMAKGIVEVEGSRVLEKIGDNILSAHEEGGWSRMGKKMQEGRGKGGSVEDGKRRKVVTMTGMLIESKLVEENAKVYYRRRKGEAKLKEGWVRHEGIKCKCCHQVFALSKFEAHAGSTNHRPAANIILPDGRPLSELHTELKDFGMQRRSNEDG